MSGGNLSELLPEDEPMKFRSLLAAAEVVVGLGIIVSIMRRRQQATADDLAALKG